MSDSDLSDAPPPAAPTDAELERSLRREVANKFKAGKQDEITVNAIRTLSEEGLGLETGFYAARAEKWKGESKRIVKDEVDKQQAQVDNSPVKAKPEPKAAKRASPVVVDERPAKKRKTASPLPPAEDGNLSSALSELDDEPRPKAIQKTAPKSKKLAAKSNGVASRKERPKAKPVPKEDAADEENSEEDVKPKARTAIQAAADSESELSSLIDEDEAPRKRRKNNDPADRKAPKPKRLSTSSKAKPKSDDDPDAAEIKRLQGWLVKCGIRKLWGKELKPYETSREKIKHLRDMLAEAGMTGRYSVEKAAQIMEARELAADIEAVQEGNERWGKDKEAAESDSESRATAKRTLTRGPKTYDFLSDGGEETD